ncbi:hypothetical protein [Mucilaginibacter phyllosphaerae]
METENPSFVFELEYAGNPVICEVIMQPTAFDIKFDGNSLATIEHTVDGTWIQASGAVLPNEIVDEIGLRIESEYL